MALLAADHGSMIYKDLASCDEAFSLHILTEFLKESLAKFCQSSARTELKAMALASQYVGGEFAGPAPPGRIGPIGPTFTVSGQRDQTGRKQSTLRGASKPTTIVMASRKLNR